MARGYYFKTKDRKMVQKNKDLCNCFKRNWDDFCDRVDDWQRKLNDYYKHEVDHFDDIVSFMEKDDESDLAAIANLDGVRIEYKRLLRIFVEAAYNSINKLTDPNMNMERWECTPEKKEKKK